MEIQEHLRYRSGVRARLISAILCAGLAALPGTAAFADQSPPPEPKPPAPDAPPDAPPESPCLPAFGEAQSLRQEGKLRAARVALDICAQPTCPEIVAVKCTEWRQEVARAQPSLLVIVKDPSGADLLDVEIRLDGALVVPELAGRPLDVDPGVHLVAVLDKKLGKALDAQVVVVEGEQGRRVELRFPSPPPVLPIPPLPPPRPISAQEGPSTLERIHPATWIAFAIGAAGAIAGTVTGVIALSRASDLEEACGGFSCSQTHAEELDEATAIAHASTAGFIIAGVGVATGVVLLPILYDDESPAVSPVVGLGFVGLRGSF